MQLRNKNYSYPVITKNGKAYENSYFLNDVSLEKEGHILSFKLEARIEDDKLKEFLEEGKVIYAHHIECPRTCYRKLVLSDKPEATLIENESKLNGQVQICSFLIANEDLPDYTNSSFSNAYKGFSFDIDKGCYLAVGTQINYSIEKDKIDITNTSSIFTISRIFDANADKMTINNDRDKIVIQLPEIICNKYKTLTGGTYLPILHAMVIQPALMETLFMLKEAAVSERLDVYENRRWFKSLKKTAQKNNIPFEPGNIKDMDVLRYSQLFLDAPEIRGIDCLYGS